MSEPSPGRDQSATKSSQRSPVFGDSEWDTPSPCRASSHIAVSRQPWRVIRHSQRGRLPVSVFTHSRATTTTAGTLVLASAVTALWQQLTSTPSHEALRAAAPVALLAGIVVLVRGLPGEKGLLRHSTTASAGLLIFAVPDAVSLLLTWTTTTGGTRDEGVLSVGLLALTLFGLVGGVVAVRIITRRHLLRKWSTRTLLAVLATRATFVVVSFVPFADHHMLLVISQASVLVPVTLLAFGVALMLTGRGPHIDKRTRRLLDK